MTPTPFKLERYFAAHEFTAKHLLCSSDPESMTIASLLALEPGAEQGLRQTWLGYTEYPGAPALREALARTYQRIDADQLVVHSGAQEAIFAFMHAMLAPGDHLIVHMPGYQSHYSVAESIGATVSPWRADEAHGWALDPDALPALLRPETRAIVLCVPHNPTGYLPSRDWFMQVVAFARRHGLILFSDEVYRGLEFDEGERLPAACDVYERAVSLGCLSKSHGLAGLRLGWIATRDAEVLARVSRFKDYLTISNSAPSEFLGKLAVRHGDTLMRRAREIASANLDTLDAFFARYPRSFDWQRPRAGTIAFPRLPGREADAFCAALLDATGVLMLPATLLDHGNAHVRIGFGRRNLPEVLPIVDAWLRGIGAG